MVDVLDGPIGSNKRKPFDPHVNELQAKLRERRKLGLAADMSDSDVIEDNDDGSDEDDILNAYRIENRGHRRTDRPSSATKRRSPVSTGTFDSGISLGDTLRPGQGNRFLKTSQISSSSQRKSEMPSITSPKQSPKDKLRQSPTDLGSMSYEQKEAIIMNRKTPTKEMQRQSPVDFQNKPWQPPSYRKVSSTPEEDSGDQIGGLMRGRKTPQDPLLESISETPSPRPRKHSAGDKKSSMMPGIDNKSPGRERKSPGLDRKSPGLDRRSPGLDRRSPSADKRSPITDRKLRESPKPLNLDDPLMSTQGTASRPTLKTDVFGSSSTMSAALDEEPAAKPRKGRFPSAERKTEGDRFGRKTPTESDRFSGRKTPTGRKTPVENDRFGGRKTPTGRLTRSSVEDEKEKQKSEKREEPSLMDFLTGGDAPKEKKKSSLFDDEEDDDKRQKPKPRRPRHEVQKDPEPEQDSFKALLARKSYKNARKPQADESSVCEELEFEPGMRKAADVTSGETQQNLRSYNKQRSDKQDAEDAIDLVAGEQSSQKIKPIQRPESAKKTTTSKVVKPKPRHSLPGTPTPSLTLSETQFNDTKSLREAIFNEWKKDRTSTLKAKHAEEKKKKEEEEKKKKEAEQEKRLENEAAYRTWKEKKVPELKDKVKDKHKEEKKKKLEQEEAERKKKDAEKEFIKWKELNDEKLKEKHKEKKRAEMRKEQEEKEKKRLREKDNESALRVWKSKKEETLKEKAKEERKKKNNTIRYVEAEKKKHEEEALEKYEEWLAKKDKQKVVEKKVRYSSMESVEERPAWSPASRTIPYGR